MRHDGEGWEASETRAEARLGGKRTEGFLYCVRAIIITRTGYRDSRRIPMIHAIVTVGVERRDHYL